MADRVRKMSYCHVKVPARAGNGAKALEVLKEAGISMQAFSGFPAGGGKAQLDFVVENVPAVRRAAGKQGWRVSPAKKGFLIQGQDRSGAALGHFRKLAEKGINVTAADAVTAGAGRYGMILWVKPKDYAKASRALGAR